VLVTDGLENEYPYIRDVTPALIAAQIQVVSIAFGYKYLSINETNVLIFFS
jgi:hypothetical protein